MFKNFKKYPKGKKIRIIAALSVLAVLVSVIVYEVVKPAPLPEYELVKAEKGSILETFTATGTVESANPSIYNIVDGVEVLELKVKVGDKVKKGDVLATFDTSGLSSQLNEVRSEYNQALKKYKDASSDSSQASSNAKDTQEEIAKLEKQISKLEKDIEKTREKEQAKLESAGNDAKSKVENAGNEAKTKLEDAGNEAKTKLEDAGNEAKEKLENSAKEAADKLKDVTVPASLDDIQKYTGTTYSKEQIEALAKQIIENGGTKEQVNNMISALNEAEKKAKEQSKELSADELAEKLKDTSAGKAIELVQLKTQLASLKTQQTYFDMQSGDTLAKAYKAVADIKKKEYEQMQSIVDVLDAGWVADNNGIVTKVNITQGEVFTSKNTNSTSNADFSQILNMLGGGGNVDITSIISQLTSGLSNESIGIQIDNYDSFIASFNVGKYDLLNLKVGQKAKVTSLDSEYEGVVDYVSATASENTGLDISSITSSLTGSTNTSSTALAKVKILKPDEKVIIGFDVDISISIGKIDDVITLPVEALRFENGKKYVFVYNEETKTVEKRTVELGSSEETKYEISDGLSTGEMVVKNPLSALKDGDKIAIATNKG